MPNPAECRFSESHEWFHVRGNLVTVGVSQHAVDELTDITFAELKRKGERIKPGDSVGEVESVKTTSDVYSAVGGTITEVNQAAIDDPSILNRDPYNEGWLVRIQTDDLAPLESLMDFDTYHAKYPVG